MSGMAHAAGSERDAPLRSSTSPNGRKRSTTESPLFLTMASASGVEMTMMTAATP